MQVPNIAIRSGSNFLFKRHEDILHVSAAGSYCTLHLKNGDTHTVARKLKDLESLLPDSFFRVHRSHIVNISHISEIVQKDSLQLVLSDGKFVPITKENKKSLIANFNKI